MGAKSCPHGMSDYSHSPPTYAYGCYRFDCLSFDIDNRREDEEGLLRAVGWINEIIQAERKAGIPPDRIIVGGLSQGGALAVLTGLTTTESLAGVFLLSSYVPLRRKVREVRACYLVIEAEYGREL